MAQRNKDGHYYQEGTFSVNGVARINDKTFTMDAQSKRSPYVYNRMNLGVEINDSEKVYVSLMGGYFPEDLRPITAFLKKEEGQDKSEKIQIPWEQRLNYDLEPLLKQRMIAFYSNDDDVPPKYFLHAYDAIKYLEGVLEDGMKLYIRGKLKYQVYKDSVNVTREITSIKISDINDHFANFEQEILYTKGAVSKSRLKDEGFYDIDAHVLQYSSDHKEDIAFPAQFVIETSEDPDKNEVAEGLSEFFDAVKRNKVYSAVVRGKMFQGYQQAENSREEIIKALGKEFAFLAKTKLAFDRQAGKSAKGQSISYYAIDNIIVTEEDGVYTPKITKEVYTEDDLIVPEIKKKEEPEAPAPSAKTLDALNKLIKEQSQS